MYCMWWGLDRGFEPKYSYKLTNPCFHADIKHELKKLRWQIYGSTTPTNNDFMLWLVRGYIAQVKGVEINWAKVVASTAREKAQRKDVGKLKNGSIDLLILSGGEATTWFGNKPTPKVEKNGSCLMQQALCPYDILSLEIRKVRELHTLLCNLEKCAYAKIREAKGEKKRLVENWLGWGFPWRIKRLL